MRFLLVLSYSLVSIYAIHQDASQQLKDDIQQAMDNATTILGYGLGFGYKDADLDFGLGSGPRTYSKKMKDKVPGDVTGKDTFQLGSGTKGFTSSAIMTLVDQGKISLDDPAHQYADITLKENHNTTMNELFGFWANNITVRDLIYMKSGLQDFETGSFDSDFLKPDESHLVHQPIECLKFVANKTGQSPCKAGCTWMFEPGTHAAYSSTNFVLAGYVLLAFMPEGHQNWDQLDLNSFLKLDLTSYEHIHFETKGEMDKIGLTTSGSAISFGEGEIWDQDQTIMGWTAGLVMGSAQDVAHFYYDLLGPQYKIVSEEGVNEMKQFNTLDEGWGSAVHLQYGAGLIKANYSPNQTPSANFIGHDGETYGYKSSNGYYESVEAAISLITNLDTDLPINLLCEIVQIIFDYKGLDEDLQCKDRIKPVHFICVLEGGEPTCVGFEGPGFPYSVCTEICNTEAKYSCHTQSSVHYCQWTWHRDGLTSEECTLEAHNSCKPSEFFLQ